MSDASRSGVRPPEVLIVEDDPVAASAYRQGLEMAGFHACVAADLTTARRLLVDRAIELVLLDLSLGGEDGLDLMTDSAHLPATQFVIVTGFASLEAAVRALRCGATEFLEKPVTTERLVDVVALRLRPSACDHARTHVTLALDRLLGFALDLESSALPQTRDALLAAMAFELQRCAQQVNAFPMLCGVFRRLAQSSEDEPASTILSDTRATLATAAPLLGSRDQRLIDASKEITKSLTMLRLDEDEWAARLGISASQLGRLLKKEYGLSFREWRRFHRVRAALPALLDTCEYVSQIGYSVGFDHAEQFSHEFGLALGVSPREFRHLTNKGRH